MSVICPGDARRALAAAERLVLLCGDACPEERRDAAVLLLQAGQPHQASSLRDTSLAVNVVCCLWWAARLRFCLHQFHGVLVPAVGDGQCRRGRSLMLRQQCNGEIAI